LPSPQSDLYSWALIFLECLTGVPVITGNSITEMIRNHLSEQEHPIPEEIRKHPLGNLLSIALNKEPNRRVLDAQNLLKELNRIDFNDLQPPLYPSNDISEHTDLENTLQMPAFIRE